MQIVSNGFWLLLSAYAQRHVFAWPGQYDLLTIIVKRISIMKSKTAAEHKLGQNPLNMQILLGTGIQDGCPKMAAMKVYGKNS